MFTLSYINPLYYKGWKAIHVYKNNTDTTNNNTDNTDYYSMSCQGHVATLLVCCYDAEF